MADAKRKSKIVTKTVEVPVITLELSEPEATTIAVLCAKVLGKDNSPRGHAGNVLLSLQHAGIDWYDSPEHKLRSNPQGDRNGYNFEAYPDYESGRLPEKR